MYARIVVYARATVTVPSNPQESGPVSRARVGRGGNGDMQVRVQSRVCEYSTVRSPRNGNRHF